MKKSIGIDLGTTNSVISFKDTVIKIIRNKENEELTRSCVGARRDEILVGRSAYQLLVSDPLNTILSVKRLMGGAIKDKMVQDMINSPYYKFTIAPLKGGTDDAVAIELGGKQYTPEQLSSEILKKLKADAEERLGDEVSHAVITVPAYFTEKQKSATKKAATLAGLKVKKLLAEPTAAAIAYGVDNLKPGETKTVIIYDFGGGTFDLSILNIVDGQYMEAGTGGDRWLGGDDIDRKLQKIVEEKVCKQYKIHDLQALTANLSEKKRFRFEGQMRYQTEEAKIQLSSTNKANILIDNILEDENGDIIDIDITITRAEFEETIRPLIEKTIELINQLIKNVGYDINLIDNILLIGGSSCIPLVKQMLSDTFGHSKIKVSEKPMLAIAEGAGILAHRLGDEYELDETDTTSIGDISYTTKHNYFIEVVDVNGNKKELIIENQTSLPIHKSKVYKTTTSNQKIAKVAIFSDVENGDYSMESIGYYTIEENLPIGTEIIFDFHIDTDEILTVFACQNGKRENLKQIILGRGGIDQKTLETIEEFIKRSISEYKTIDGEEKLMKFIIEKINEIDAIGATNINDNKWWEINYTTTEKFDEIKSNETPISNNEIVMSKATRLIIEFGELLNPIDKESVISILTQIQSNTDAYEKAILITQLEEKIENYSLLISALQIESLANRILEMPIIVIGNSTKQADVARLRQLYIDAKTKLLMHQTSDARELIDEAYVIIDKYLS